jgi:hypothetical protein
MYTAGSVSAFQKKILHGAELYKPLSCIWKILRIVEPAFVKPKAKSCKRYKF